MSTTEVNLHREDSYKITQYSDTEIAVIVTNYAGKQAEMILDKKETVEFVERLLARFC